MVEAEEVQKIVRQLDLGYFYSLASFAILYYDYILTLDEEIIFFWKRKINLVTALFFLNRYFGLFGNAAVILQSFRSWSPATCDNIQKYHQFFSVIVQTFVGVIMIIRTYAIYERDRRVLASLTIVALTVIAVGVWSFTGDAAEEFPPFDTSFKVGCHPWISQEEGIRLSIAWAGLMCFDSIVFAFTIQKAICMWKMGSRRLFHVLLRDGAIYYFVLTMATLSNILTFLFADPILKGVSTTFANVMSITIISRLMLNLQNPALFETTQIYTTSVNLGPFVTTVVLDRHLRSEDEEWECGELRSGWSVETGKSGSESTRLGTASGGSVGGSRGQSMSLGTADESMSVSVDSRSGLVRGAGRTGTAGSETRLEAEPTWEGWGWDRRSVREARGCGRGHEGVV